MVQILILLLSFQFVLEKFFCLYFQIHIAALLEILREEIYD